MAWITSDGEYSGSSEILEFDYAFLTADQWGRLEEMSASDRLDYVKFIIEGHDMNVREIEMENFGEEWGL